MRPLQGWEGTEQMLGTWTRAPFSYEDANGAVRPPNGYGRLPGPADPAAARDIRAVLDACEKLLHARTPDLAVDCLTDRWEFLCRRYGTITQADLDAA